MRIIYWNMKKTIVTFVLLVCMGAAVCSGQNESVIRGKVIDKNSGEPVGYATAAIVRQDSIVVAGSMAAEDGSFELKASNGKNTLVISMVGYRNARKEITVSGHACDAGTIELEEDTISLEGAVVQVQLPRTELKGDAIVTNISGSVLEHSGNAQDLMTKIPGMIKRDGKMEVIGRGEPVYYINGRRVLDPDELRSIMSEEVRAIDVVNNPGAAYGGEIKAVVRIRTIRRRGEGFSFALTSQAKKFLSTKDFDPSWTVLDLNYRKGNVDFIGKVTFWDNHNHQYADIQEESYVPGKLFWQGGDLKVRQHTYGLNERFGINWQINENHSAGFQVERKDLLYGQYKEEVTEDVKMNGNLIDRLTSTNLGRLVKESGWDGNIYYNGKVGELEIDFNTDFQTKDSFSTSDVTEKSLIEPRTIFSSVESGTGVIASKLVFKYPIWKGQIQAGAEGSYVKARQEHKITFEEIAPSNAQIKENTIAGFVEYALPFESWQFSAGIRYEHVDYSYTDFLGKNDIDRKQDNWFPSASFSTRLGKVELSASVSGKTMRPNFWQLSNEMQYHSRFTYQTGDPKLKNEKYLDAALNARWKWLTFSAAYENIKDAIEQWGLPYNDEGVTMMKYTNLDSPINIYSAYLVAAPTVGCWNPQYTVGVRKQTFKTTVIDIREPGGRRSISYDKPMLMLQLNNSFRFKHSWQLSADYQFNSRMSYGAAQILVPKNILELSAQKSFLKDDALTIRLSVADVLNGSKESVSVDYGQFNLYQSNDFKSPAVILRISYHFNSAASKYKGTGAGESVKNRL